MKRKSKKEAYEHYLETFKISEKEREAVETIFDGRISMNEVDYDKVGDNNSLSEAINWSRPEWLNKNREKLNDLLPCLTPKQKEIVALICKDYTQKQIAEELNITQGTVSISINGQTQINNGKKKRYGGIINRLRKEKIKKEAK